MANLPNTFYQNIHWFVHSTNTDEGSLSERHWGLKEQTVLSLPPGHLSLLKAGGRHITNHNTAITSRYHCFLTIKEYATILTELLTFPDLQRGNYFPFTNTSKEGRITFCDIGP